MMKWKRDVLGKRDVLWKRRLQWKAESRKRIPVMMVYVLALLLCVGGCGASESFDHAVTTAGNSSYNSSDYDGSGFITAEGGSMGDDFGDNGASVPEEGKLLDERKLITTVKLEVETKEFEQMMSVLQERVREMDGYIESMDAYNGSNYSRNRSSRYANLVVRIPASGLNEFLDTVSDIGNVVRRNDDIKDVTLSYVDLESHAKTLRTEQSRLLAFLEKAESVEQIILLEERLSEVRYQLESMESQLRTMDNLVDYSTVKLAISEVKELTPAAEQSAWEKIAEGFTENAHHLWDGLVNVCIWFVVNIPYFLAWAVVITGIVLFWRRLCRKRSQKKEDLQKKEKGQN